MKMLIVFSIVLLILTSGEITRSIGVITITIDDGNPTVHNAYKILSRRELPATIFLIQGSLEDINRNVTFLKKVYDAGWEIGTHSVNHPDMTMINYSELEYQIKYPKQYYTELGFSVQSMVFPYNRYQEREIRIADKYYTIVRGINYPRNYERASLTNVALKGKYIFQSMDRNNITEDKIIDLINQSIEGNNWLVLLFHKVYENGALVNNPKINLINITNYIKQKVDEGKVEVKTFIDAWYSIKNVSPIINISRFVGDGDNISYDLRQDTIDNPRLIIGGVTAGNFARNPSFERWSSGNPDEWIKDTGVISWRASTNSLYGNYSIEITANASSPAWKRDINLANIYDLKEGNEFNLVIYAKNVRNITKVGICLMFYDKNGTYIDCSCKIQDIGENWTKLMVSGICPPGTNKTLIQIKPKDFVDGATQGTYRVDGVFLSNAIVTDYFEGIRNSKNISVTIGGYTVSYEDDLPSGKYIEFDLPKEINKFGNILVSVGGSHSVKLILQGDRLFNVRYGWVEYDENTGMYNVTEYFENVTEVEIWKSGRIACVRDAVRYIVPGGVTATIGELQVRPTIKCAVKVNEYSDTYVKFNANASQNDAVEFTLHRLKPNHNYEIWIDGNRYYNLSSGTDGTIVFTWNNWSNHVFDIKDMGFSAKTSITNTKTPALSIGNLVLIVILVIIFMRRKYHLQS